MITSKAGFYWSGPKMSSLRERSIESFRRQNPDWEVEVFGEELAPELSHLPAGLEMIRSDLARYRWLSTSGGLYLDTDIIFMRPLPEHWLGCDVLATVGHPEREPGIAQVGCLGSSPSGRRFWEVALKRATKVIAEDAFLGIQSIGTHLFLDFPLAVFCENLGLTLFDLPKAPLLPVPWYQAEHCWAPGAPPEGAVGLHWYGGHLLSRVHEHAVPPGSMVDLALAEAFREVEA